MAYDVIATDAVARAIKQRQRGQPLLDALDKKLKQLREDPHNVGKPLAGKLHGYYTTRLVKNFRLIFSVDEKTHMVTLHALDHRKDVYG